MLANNFGLLTSINSKNQVGFGKTLKLCYRRRLRQVKYKFLILEKNQRKGNK